MMKVWTPDGKVTQAGSLVSPTRETACCSRQAYLYMDMLRLLTMFCKHKSANLALMQVWHSEMKTYYMDLMLTEDLSSRLGT